VEIHAELQALRDDDAPQRHAQAELIALAEAWRARPAAARVLDALARFDGAGPLADSPPLAALFDPAAPDARDLVDAFVAMTLGAMRRLPLGHPAFRHVAEASFAVLQLGRAGNSTLSLVTHDGAALAARPAPVTADFAPIDTWDRVLAGTGRADLIECRALDDQRADLAVRSLALGPDTVLARRAGRDVLQLRAVDGLMVTLRLQRRIAGAGATREYALADGALVHLAAGNPNDSRRELMMALLGRMGRADAAPLLADLAREPGSDSLRWQALREALALDTASGFAALVDVARSPGDALAPAAGALRAQLVEQWPQLAEIEACPM